MITSFQPSKVLVLLLAACLVWIGGISTVVASFVGKGVSTGWIVAGALVFALVVWSAMVLREVRRAIELPDYLTVAEFEAHLARTNLDSGMTFSRTGMDKLPVGRPAMGDRKSPPRSRRRSRSRIATSRNSATDQ